MNNNANILEIIKAQVYSMMPECKLILFGSRVIGSNRENSDYDLLIISSQNFNVQEKMLYKSAIRKALAKMKIPTDILIHSEREIGVKQNLPGHIVKEILRYGKRI